MEMNSESLICSMEQFIYHTMAAEKTSSYNSILEEVIQKENDIKEFKKSLYKTKKGRITEKVLNCLDEAQKILNACSENAKSPSIIIYGSFNDLNENKEIKKIIEKKAEEKGFSLCRIEDSETIKPGLRNRIAGVIWFFDEKNTDLKMPSEMINQLIVNLKEFSNIKENITGVIYNLDFSEDAENISENIRLDYKKVFGKYFSEIITVFEKENQPEYKSGISDLYNIIEKMLISNMETVVNSCTYENSRESRYVLKVIEDYLKEIDRYSKKYLNTEEKFDHLKRNLKENITAEINNFYENYIQEVEERIENNNDISSEGNAEVYIKNKIYKADSFLAEQDRFFKGMLIRMKNFVKGWEELCLLGEDRYNADKDFLEKYAVKLKKPLNLSALKDIEGVGVKNFSMHLKPNAKKAKIKEQIKNIMTKECRRMQSEAVSCAAANVNKIELNCDRLLNETFESVLCEFLEKDFVKEKALILQKKLKIKDENIQVKELIFD